MIALIVFCAFPWLVVRSRVYNAVNSSYRNIRFGFRPDYREAYVVYAGLAILKPIDEYKTTYPNKVFDYMAAGKPVILAIDGVIREVVEAGGCGIFAQPGDPSALVHAVQVLAADRARSRQMGLAGRQYLEKHFDRSALADKLVAIMESMVTRKLKQNTKTRLWKE